MSVATCISVFDMAIVAKDKQLPGCNLLVPCQYSYRILTLLMGV